MIDILWNLGKVERGKSKLKVSSKVLKRSKTCAPVWMKTRTDIYIHDKTRQPGFRQPDTSMILSEFEHEQIKSLSTFTTRT